MGEQPEFIHAECGRRMRSLRLSLRGDTRGVGRAGSADRGGRTGGAGTSISARFRLCGFRGTKRIRSPTDSTWGKAWEGSVLTPPIRSWCATMRIWDAHWGFQPGSPSVAVDGMDLFSVRYGIFQPGYDPLIRPYGTATFKGVRQSGVLPASPTALPGERAPLPTGIDDRASVHGDHTRHRPIARDGSWCAARPPTTAR